MAIGTNIPATVIQKLIPILINQLEGLANASAIIDKLMASVTSEIKCNDPIIQNIKVNLEKIQKLIDNIRKVLGALQKIRTALNTTAGVAKTIELVQLVLPLPPFAPPGAIAKTLNLVISLGNNCKSASKCLNGLLSSAELAISMASDAIAAASLLLSNVCNQEDVVVDKSTALLISRNINQSVNDNVLTNANTGTDFINASANISSIFYTKFNVSTEDLSKYQEDADTLLSEYKDILTNLIEAPSAVYIEVNDPAPEFGNSGDYYIDTENQLIYGPKISAQEWGNGTKY